mmetsp:Transcript_7281/g.12466  ORF Transcript_7281/g.12466 Transcript_7281/m.12466 type:complete len:264 (-) Transcript_7281:828-1619(-)
MAELQRRVQREFCLGQFVEEGKAMLSVMQNCVDETVALTVENQLRMMPSIGDLRRRLRSECGDWAEGRTELDALQSQLMDFSALHGAEYFTMIRNAIVALSLRVDLHIVLTSKNSRIEKADKQRAEELRRLLKQGAQSEDGLKAIQKEVQQLQQRAGTTISKEEIAQVVKALQNDLRGTGHWFKCKNGHPYAIGECGGAMEKSRCPECNEVIGGQSHRLHDGNQFAPEMDNAPHPAWSEFTNNLANFRMDDDDNFDDFDDFDR